MSHGPAVERLAPNYGAVSGRLRSVLSPAEWAPGAWGDLGEAVRAKDSAMLLSVRDRLVAFAPANKQADVIATFTAKRVR